MTSRRTPLRGVRSLGVWLGLSLGVGVVPVGCAEAPSFSVEWAFAPSLDELDDAVTPNVEAECAARGVDEIRVQTFIASSGNEIDDRAFECAAGPGDGPELEPGEYRVEVSGVRRAGGDWSCVVTELPLEVCAERATCDAAAEGGEWCTCDSQADCADGLTCVARTDIRDQCDPDGGDDAVRTCMACSVRRVHELTVGEGDDPQALVTVLLDPPQCDDGIDNDGDGLADALDPACARDARSREDDDAGDAVFTLGVSFLNNNPAVDCFEARVGVIRAEIVELATGTVVEDLSLACARTIPPFARPLGEGEYELRVTGELAGSTDAATTTKIRPFSVSPTQGAFVAESFDFDDDDFLTPLMGPVAFFSSYEFVEGLPARTGCVGSSSSLSHLEIEELRVRVLDENDDSVDPASLSIPGAIDEGDGAFRIPCPTTVVESDVDLTWNDYSVSVEALVAGETCFATTDPVALAPRTPQSIVLGRVLTDGVPTGACIDCMVDSDCQSARCDAGLCVPV